MLAAFINRIVNKKQKRVSSNILIPINAEMLSEAKMPLVRYKTQSRKEAKIKFM